jgi:DNA-directed RNA polymerase specialized sigma24 family protein
VSRDTGELFQLPYVPIHQPGSDARERRLADGLERKHANALSHEGAMSRHTQLPAATVATLAAIDTYSNNNVSDAGATATASTHQYSTARVHTMRALSPRSAASREFDIVSNKLRSQGPNSSEHQHTSNTINTNVGPNGSGSIQHRTGWSDPLVMADAVKSQARRLADPSTFDHHHARLVSAGTRSVSALNTEVQQGFARPTGECTAQAERAIKNLSLVSLQPSEMRLSAFESTLLKSATSPKYLQVSQSAGKMSARQFQYQHEMTGGSISTPRRLYSSQELDRSSDGGGSPAYSPGSAGYNDNEIGNGEYNNHTGSLRENESEVHQIMTLSGNYTSMLLPAPVPLLRVSSRLSRSVTRGSSALSISASTARNRSLTQLRSAQSARTRASQESLGSTFDVKTTSILSQDQLAERAVNQASRRLRLQHLATGHAEKHPNSPEELVESAPATSRTLIALRSARGLAAKDVAPKSGTRVDTLGSMSLRSDEHDQRAPRTIHPGRTESRPGTRRFVRTPLSHAKLAGSVSTSTLRLQGKVDSLARAAYEAEIRAVDDLPDPSAFGSSVKVEALA